MGSDIPHEKRNETGDTILLLWGQWLFDPYTYGAENYTIPDDVETFLNAQDRRFAFPCTKFTIHRSPEPGRVLKIETNGQMENDL